MHSRYAIAVLHCMYRAGHDSGVEYCVWLVYMLCCVWAWVFLISDVLFLTPIIQSQPNIGYFVYLVQLISLL